MKKQPIQARIGDDKLLILHADSNNPADADFIKIFQQAASTRPQSIQEFFMTINNLQQSGSQEGETSIKLRNLKIYDRLSHETIAFTADLYINNIKAGTTNNTGQGAETTYQPINDTGKQLIKQAENWCTNQPPEILKDVPTKGHNITIPQSLDNYIDTIVSNSQKEKLLKNFNRRLIKHSERSIVFGIPDQQYRRYGLPLPMTEMLANEKRRAELHTAIHKYVLPNLKSGEKILNTNIPKGLLVPQRKITSKPTIKNHQNKGKTL